MPEWLAALVPELEWLAMLALELAVLMRLRLRLAIPALVWVAALALV